MSELWLQRLSHPLIRPLAAVMFGLIFAIFAIDLAVAGADALGLPDWLSNLAATVAAAVAGTTSAVYVYRALKRLADDYKDSLSD